ncbi:hypothetical protein K469DRAFT_703703 [Zopfia rhizophila CBS 207.26]|uniref:Uncharacterized protein n=1 Tax=Zopfia rhizophila CBS 207.26 TaxID=1314779 RepID=A0A6A6E8D7_9PEZI|nr:hypothetical protein K469DRAFT_703703 [Zopfia rhizophila CBS 207.26]
MALKLASALQRGGMLVWCRVQLKQGIRHVIFYGRNVKPSYDRSGRYRLIGTCCIHRIMKGEVMQFEGTESEMFVLH